MAYYLVSRFYFKMKKISSKNISLNKSQSDNLINQQKQNVDLQLKYQDDYDKSYKFRFYGDYTIIANNVLLEEHPVKIIKNSDGWYLDENATILEPTKERFNNNIFKLSILYPQYKNYNTLTFNNIDIKDGIAVYTYMPIIYGEKIMTYFVCSLNHNLQKDDLINLNINGVVTQIKIVNIGDLRGFNDNCTFICDIQIINNQTLYFTKEKSIYYSLWGSKLISNNGFDVFKKNIGVNIYNDDNYSFFTKTDIDISQINNIVFKDNPFLFLNLENINNDFWNKKYYGLNTNLIGSDYDINSIINDNYIQRSDLINDVYFIGIFENNNGIISMLNETVCKFNSLNRVINNYNEGYFYNPLVKLDLDKNNFQFKNNNFYSYLNHNFHIKRQDLCGKYNIDEFTIIKDICTDLDKNALNNIIC